MDRKDQRPARCRRHEWTWRSDDPADGERCRYCDAVRDDRPPLSELEKRWAWGDR